MRCKKCDVASSPVSWLQLRVNPIVMWLLPMCGSVLYRKAPNEWAKVKFFQWRVRDSPNLILHLNPKAKGRTLVVGTAPFFFRTSSPVISRVDVIVDRETDLDNWHCCQGWCNLSSPVTFTRNAPETFGKIRFLSILKKRASLLTRCWFYCCDLDDILYF